MTGEHRKAGIDLGLTDEEKAQLRGIARQAIISRLEGRHPPDLINESEKLKQPRGAFVSLHKHGRLRGCIGHIRTERPLQNTIREMACAAAFEDPRFSALRKEELADLDIEISVLTPLEKITDISEIEVGKHGLYITKGFCAGLLLPQVAVDYAWDRITFLEQTCLKAGLAVHAWKDNNADIFIFSADIF